MDDVEDDVSSLSKKEATELAIQYHIASKLTSIVAVDLDKNKLSNESMKEVNEPVLQDLTGLAETKVVALFLCSYSSSIPCFSIL